MDAASVLSLTNSVKFTSRVGTCARARAQDTRWVYHCTNEDLRTVSRAKYTNDAVNKDVGAKHSDLAAVIPC